MQNSRPGWNWMVAAMVAIGMALSVVSLAKTAGVLQKVPVVTGR